MKTYHVATLAPNVLVDAHNAPRPPRWGVIRVGGLAGQSRASSATWANVGRQANPAGIAAGALDVSA